MTPSDEQKTRAHVIPFVIFMGLMLLDMLASMTGFTHDHPSMPWYRRHPEYVVMLLQIIICFPMFFYWRNCYEWNVKKGYLWGILAGAIGIAFWILPTHLYTALDLGKTPDPSWYEWFGLAPRDEGFDGAIFAENPTTWWIAVILRFFRAVIVVALVEEVFWRGFLMRFLLKMDGNYWKVPFGKKNVLSYCVVTCAFTLAHAPVDWLGCLIFGTIIYFLATQTKSLFACILAHGVANLIMGFYALHFAKYGLW